MGRCGLRHRRYTGRNRSPKGYQLPWPDFTRNWVSTPGGFPAQDRVIQPTDAGIRDGCTL